MDRLASIPVRVSDKLRGGKQLTPLSPISIPVRVLGCLHTVRGRKPPSLATEVSIPVRVSRANKSLSLLPSKLDDTG